MDKETIERIEKRLYMKRKTRQLYSMSRLIYGTGWLAFALIHSFGWSLIALVVLLLLSLIVEIWADKTLDQVGDIDVTIKVDISADDGEKKLQEALKDCGFCKKCKPGKFSKVTE